MCVIDSSVDDADSHAFTEVTQGVKLVNTRLPVGRLSVGDLGGGGVSGLGPTWREDLLVERGWAIPECDLSRQIHKLHPRQQEIRQERGTECPKQSYGKGKGSYCSPAGTT